MLGLWGISCPQHRHGCLETLAAHSYFTPPPPPFFFLLHSSVVADSHDTLVNQQCTAGVWGGWVALWGGHLPTTQVWATRDTGSTFSVYSSVVSDSHYTIVKQTCAGSAFLVVGATCVAVSSRRAAC